MQAIAAVLVVCSLSAPTPECGLGASLDVLRVPGVSDHTPCGVRLALLPGTDRFLAVACRRRQVGDMPVAAR